MLKNFQIIWFGEHLRSEWNNIWVREQEVCTWLAENNDVYYVERLNAENPKLINLWNRLKKRFLIPNPGTSSGSGINNLQFIHFKLLPLHFKWLERINNWIISYQIKKFFPTVNPNKYILFVSHPSKFILQIIKKIPEPPLMIYQCVDQFQYKNGYGRNALETDTTLTQKADLVITPSKTILAEKRKLNANTYRIPHGVSNEITSYSKIISSSNKYSTDKKKTPEICYFGTFHHIFDFELIRCAANMFKQFRFVFWGPITENARIQFKGIPNIELCGYLPVKEAAHRIGNSDVCIIPYIRNNFSDGVFPHKLFQYLATGLPIVATKLPDLEDFEPWVDLAKDHQDFLEMIKKGVHHARDPIYMQKRLQQISNLLENYSFEKQMSRLHQLIENRLSYQPKNSLQAEVV